MSIETRTGGKNTNKKSLGIKTIVAQTISIVHGRATADFLKNIDLVLYPDVEKYAWDDSNKGLSMMRCGMEACFDRLGDIQKMIREKGGGSGFAGNQ